jgi:hypothetical protein
MERRKYRYERGKGKENGGKPFYVEFQRFSH